MCEWGGGGGGVLMLVVRVAKGRLLEMTRGHNKPIWKIGRERRNGKLGYQKDKTDEQEVKRVKESMKKVQLV